MVGRIAPQPGVHGRAWATVGEDGRLELDRVELVWVDLPFVTPVGTAVGTHRTRPLVLVHLVCRRSDGVVVEGWGECAALVDTTYDREDATGTFATLRSELLPALVGLTRAGGSLPPVSGLGAILDTASRPLASATVEMAVGDAHLRAAGRSLADLLGVSDRRVEPGAVLGLPRSAEELSAAIATLTAAGYARVKVKVAPGCEAIIDEAVRPTVGSWPMLQVDANGTYGDDAASRLHRLDDLGLACIEQPLGRDDFDGHRRLAAALATPICLDESLDSPSSVVEAVGSGACSVVCVKPARLGGIGAALDVISWCTDAGVLWWVGGMFESGYARGVNTALAALPGHSLPGDLAPPATYLVADVVQAVPGEVDGTTGRLSLPVPTGSGLGPHPDRELFRAFESHRVVVWPGDS